MAKCLKFCLYSPRNMKMILGQASVPVRIVTGSPPRHKAGMWITLLWQSHTKSFKLRVPLQAIKFPLQLRYYVPKRMCVDISFTAGEFWRSIRLPESSAVVILDMCVFPHCDHVYGGLWWRLLPDCPRTYIPGVFPPRWLGKFTQWTSFFILLVQLIYCDSSFILSLSVVCQYLAYFIEYPHCLK
jgi:hypothetical protein